MERVKSIIVILAITVLIAGCSNLTVRPSVRDNVFLSLSTPKIRIQIPEEIKYIGEIDISNSIFLQKIRNDGGLVSGKIYGFVQVDQGSRLRKGFFVVMKTIHDPLIYYSPDQFAGEIHKLESGHTEIDESEFNYLIRVIPGSHIRFNIDEILFERGIVVTPSCMEKCLVKRYGNRRSLLFIIYIEDIYYDEDNLYKNCNEWIPVKDLSLSQRKLIEGFKDRFERNVKIASKNIAE